MMTTVKDANKSPIAMVAGRSNVADATLITEPMAGVEGATGR
jgi:hypothetical protein